MYTRGGFCSNSERKESGRTRQSHCEGVCLQRHMKHNATHPAALYRQEWATARKLTESGVKSMSWALCERGRWGFVVNKVKQPSALLARATHLDAKMTYRRIYQPVAYCLRLERWSPEWCAIAGIINSVPWLRVHTTCDVEGKVYG